MAYQNKYKVTFATKSGKTAYLYLQEDGYSGSVIEYQGIHIDYQYIPNSDDPFEVVYASQINATIDITDDMENMPNFSTLNDRKYFAKLYINSDLQFFGFTISDSVQVSFSTGRKELSFNAFDGIGLLKNIKFPVVNTSNINNLNNLLYYITTALNTLNFPITPNIIVACSIYAEGMQTRTDHTYSEPFSQSYLPFRTFLSTPLVYLSCYDVIVNILKSFGCRFFIANGKWYIVNINDFARENIYYTEYSNTGTVVTSGTFNSLSVIQGFTGNTSGLYFIDGSQSKILRKGYNKITAPINVVGAQNYLSGGDLRPIVGTFPLFWTAAKTTGSTWEVLSFPNESSDAFKLFKQNTAGSYVYVENQSLPKIGEGNLLTFDFTYYSQDVTGVRGYIVIELRQDSTVYYYTSNGWTPYGPVNAFQVDAYSSDATSISKKNDVSFSTTVPTPISGQIYFQLRLEEGTCQNIQVGAFNMTITPALKQINYNAYISSSDDYVNTIEIPYGSYSTSTNYPAEYGILLKSDNTALINWFSFGHSTTYTSLVGLLTQQYINVFGTNIINIDCNLSSFSTANGYLNAAKVIKATDTDPSQINVSSNYYMMGNTTINYANDETQATLLQINGSDISATVNYTLTYNQ
jgi:hypothetical protein